MLAGDLAKGGLPAIFGPNQLVIRFSSGYNPQYQNCADPTRLARIQDAVRLITAESWTVRVELDAAAPADPVVSTQQRTTAAAPGIDPLVSAVQSVFDARILKVDDGFGRKAEKKESRVEESAEAELPEIGPEDD